jgi:hypothetical protein
MNMIAKFASIAMTVAPTLVQSSGAFNPAKDKLKELIANAKQHQGVDHLAKFVKKFVKTRSGKALMKLFGTADIDFVEDLVREFGRDVPEFTRLLRKLKDKTGQQYHDIIRPKKCTRVSVNNYNDDGECPCGSMIKCADCTECM